MKVLVTMKRGPLRDSFIDRESRELLERNFSVTYNELSRDFAEEEIKKAILPCYDILLTGWGTPNLSHIAGEFSLLAHTGGSVGDLIDGDAYSVGLRVVSANKIYARSTAEGAFAYILSALRQVPSLTAKMRSEGFWDGSGEYFTRSLYGKTVGVIGVGAVAKNLIDLLKPFGLKLMLFDDYDIGDRYLKETGAVISALDEIFATCDVISVHAALSDKTFHMIGERELSLIRDGALFVNTSRGAVVDEAALIRALSEKRFYAFLDVFEHEPLDKTSPLRKLDNVYLMPHKAGPANDLYSYIGREIVLDMIRFKNGEPLKYSVTREEALRMTRHNVGRAGT